MKASFVLSVVGLLALASAGETVAWWRFGDLGPNGGQAATGQTFTNCVDASKYPAYAASFKNQTVGSQAEWMPSATNAFADARRVVLRDPVSGSLHSLSPALHCPWGGDKSELSGGAYVEPDPALIGQGEGGTGDFTVECFFRTTAEGIARSQSMEALVGQKSSGYQGAWSLMIYGGKLWGRFTVTDNVSGSEVSTSTDQGSCPTVVTPDVWHHAAMVFSSTKSSIRLYLDYKLETTRLIPVSEGARPLVTPGAGERIYIGKGRYNSDRSLDGEIAEVRISDAALDPSDFLRFESYGAGDRAGEGDQDVVGWYSLDDTSSFGTNQFFAANSGLCTKYAPECFASLKNDASHVWSFDGDPGETRIRAAVIDGIAHTNAAALSVRTNAVGAAAIDNAYVQMSDTLAHAAESDFTQEFFFRTHEPITGSASHWGIGCSSFYKALVMNNAPGTLLVRIKYTDKDQDYTVGGYRFDDGRWHHVAIVADAQARTVKVYVDYQLVGQRTDCRLKTGSSTPAWTFGSARENANAPQYFNGQVDEVRIVRRALSPDEFLSRGEGASDALLQVRFEDAGVVYPYGFVPCATFANNSSPFNVLPSYTNDVRRATVDFRDETLGVRDNRQSLAFAGGALGLPEIPGINRSNMTVEFLIKLLGRGAPWVSVMGYSNTYKGGSTWGDKSTSWAVTFDSDWTKLRILFWASVGADTQSLDSCRQQLALSPTYGFTDLSHKGDTVGYGSYDPGSRWHHVAITFDEFEEGGVTKTRLTTYWDYRQVDTKTCEGRLRLPERGYLTFGKSSYASRFADYEIDELRITEGVLPPEKFYHNERQGVYMIVR